jgi:hypothetical protein
LSHDKSYSEELHEVSEDTIATSAVVTSNTKRNYLADYKPFRDAFSVRNITLQILKAGILSFSNAMTEYNAYLDRSIAEAAEAEEKGIKYRGDDFDWPACVDKYTPQFITMATRFLATSIIKKSYEAIAVASLSAQTADRLTKDLVKSVLRKVARYSRLNACRKVFMTAMWANLLINASMLTYDILYNIAHAIRAKRIRHTPGQMVVWTSKKTVFYAVGMTFSAFGFSLGALLFPEYCSQIGAAVFETGSQIVTASVLAL